MANEYLWGQGQQGGVMRGPTPTQRPPSLLETALLPLLGSTLEKKKSEISAMEKAFPAMVQAGMISPPSEGERGNINVAGMPWNVTGKAQELPEEYKIWGNMLEMAAMMGDEQGWQSIVSRMPQEARERYFGKQPTVEPTTEPNEAIKALGSTLSDMAQGKIDDNITDEMAEELILEGVDNNLVTPDEVLMIREQVRRRQQRTQRGVRAPGAPGVEPAKTPKGKPRPKEKPIGVTVPYTGVPTTAKDLMGAETYGSIKGMVGDIAPHLQGLTMPGPAVGPGYPFPGVTNPFQMFNPLLQAAQGGYPAGQAFGRQIGQQLPWLQPPQGIPRHQAPSFPMIPLGIVGNRGGGGGSW